MEINLKQHFYKLELSYLGTRFYGWQSQPQGNTIQQSLEKALTTILRNPTKVLGAARTDSGVHAMHQVATFCSPHPLNPPLVMRGLVALLPKSIGVYSLTPVQSSFHPIAQSTGKVYVYRIYHGQGRHAFNSQYCWNIHQKLDLSSMQTAANRLVGRHDFTSFSAQDSCAKSKIRTVQSIHFTKNNHTLFVWFAGRGFLKQMIRIIVGTLVEIGLGKRSPESMSAILALRQRDAAGKTAPACGLSLIHVCYGENPLKIIEDMAKQTQYL